MSWPPKVKALICCVIFAVFAALGLFWYVNALQPTPSYDVDTYQQLTNELRRRGSIVVPDEELLPPKLNYLSLYNPSRLTFGVKVGYTILGATKEGRHFSLNCQELDSYSSAGQPVPEFHPNKIYCDVPIEYYEGVTTLSISFRTEACWYHISVEKNPQETFLQEEKESVERIARNIIDKNFTLD